MKKPKKGLPPQFAKKGKKPAMKKVGKAEGDGDMAMLKRRKMPA